MPYFFISSLENALDASMIAALACGPKHGIPASSMASVMPAANGSSGVTTQKSTLFSFANDTSPSLSIALISTQTASAEIPPLPGAHQIVSISLFSFNLRMTACSLPPDPMTSTFIYAKPLMINGGTDVHRRMPLLCCICHMFQ